MPARRPATSQDPASKATGLSSPEKPVLAVTPMAFVRAILQAYTARGMACDEALKSAQIAPKLAHKISARITAAQMEAISSHAMHELNDEGLGCFQRRLPWGSYGMLLRACLTAPTLGLALKRWCRHHGLITDDIALSVKNQEGAATITLIECCDLGAQREFALLSVLRNLHGVACWLVDSRMLLQRVQLPFPAPVHHAVYPLMFPGPVFFGQGPTQLVFDARYLDLPLRRDEKALQHMLQRALTLTVLQYRRDRLLVPQVRQALWAHPQETHSAKTLAPMLNLSPRSLHRQLQEEGISLQFLKDQVRRDRAMELLQRTAKPVKQVAQAAGFQDEKSFMRAFKHWTGQTPAAFRDARHKSGNAPM